MHFYKPFGKVDEHDKPFRKIIKNPLEKGWWKYNTQNSSWEDLLQNVYEDHQWSKRFMKRYMCGLTNLFNWSKGLWKGMWMGLWISSTDVRVYEKVYKWVDGSFQLTQRFMKWYIILLIDLFNGLQGLWRDTWVDYWTTKGSTQKPTLLFSHPISIKLSENVSLG